MGSVERFVGGQTDNILVDGHNVDICALQSIKRDDATDAALNPVRYVIFCRSTCARTSRVRLIHVKQSGRGVKCTLRKRITGGVVELTKERMNESWWEMRPRRD